MTNTAEYNNDGTRVRNLKESASRKGKQATLTIQTNKQTI